MAIYPSAKVEKTKVITIDNGLKFVTNGTSILEKGWMAVGTPSKENFIPTLKKDEKVDGTYELLEKKTEPPKRYTDKTIIAAMISADKDSDEKDIKSLSELNIAGIGTEATRAGIIETLASRGYIERNKKSICATEKGISLIQGFPVDDLKSASLTAAWETRLANIASGKEDDAIFIRDIEKATANWCAIVESDMKKISSVSTGPTSSSTGLTCPLCGSDIVKQKWGYGCSGYKSGCKFSISNNIAGKKLTDKQIESLLSKGSTSVIKGFTSKSGKKFNAKLELLPDGKTSFKFE